MDYYPDPDSAYEDQFHSEDAEYYDTKEVYGNEYDDEDYHFFGDFE